LTELAVLVPFKGGNRKSRLTGLLGIEGAARFAWLLLEDLLDVLADAGILNDSFVITSDPKALFLARKIGAGGLAESRDLGVSAAIAAGMAKLRERERFLVLPSDLPLLSARDLRRILDYSDQGFVVLSPSSSFSGTNVLMFGRLQAPPLRYDDDSFWSHLSGAAHKGSRTAIAASRGIVFDVDSKEDFFTLARARINIRSVAFAKKVVSEWGS